LARKQTSPLPSAAEKSKLIEHFDTFFFFSSFKLYPKEENFLLFAFALL